MSSPLRSGKKKKKTSTRSVKKAGNLYSVIIAGGSGTRFWPLSRQETPKQLLSIYGDKTLIQSTVSRISSLIPPERTRIVTGSGQAESIRLQLVNMPAGPLSAKFIIEPESKNTAPAIGLAAVYVKHIDPEAVMVVLPSDHIIRDKNKFLKAVLLGAAAADDGYLVTIGIMPDRPETGYGYIRRGRSIRKGISAVKEFREKPDREKAEMYLKTGGYYWNSGIFIWRADAILMAIEKHMPGLYRGLARIEKSMGTGRSEKVTKSVFALLKPESIDYGVLEPASQRGEKANKVAVVPSDMKWSDVGSWHALDNVLPVDSDNNIRKGNLISIDNKNSILYCGTRLVSAIGLNDIIIVDTPDATLICPKSRAQDVRQVVDILKKKKAKEGIIHTTVYRPWGLYTVLETGAGFKIKKIEVKPGAKLSHQMHRRRSEHWVVVSGTATVTNGKDVYKVRTNESTYIPRLTKHRLENTGRTPLQIIEVQSGSYVEEDDIVRFDDIYHRKTKK